ncbi:hypothetical protein Bca4012_046138 [Brassica carinata]
MQLAGKDTAHHVDDRHVINENMSKPESTIFLRKEPVKRRGKAPSIGAKEPVENPLKQNSLHKRFNQEIYSDGSTHKKRQLSAIDLKNSVFQHAQIDIFEGLNKHEDATVFERKGKFMEAQTKSQLE